MPTFYDITTPDAEATAYNALLKQENVPFARQQSRMNGFHDGWAAARQADTDAGIKRIKADDETVNALAQTLYTQAVNDLVGGDVDAAPQWAHLHPAHMGRWEYRARVVLESLPGNTQL